MLNLVAKRNWFYAVSLLVLIPGLISLAIPPRLRAGIEFTSGTTFAFRYVEAATNEQVESAVRDELSKQGVDSDVRVQRTGNNEFLVHTEEIEGSSRTPPVGPALPSTREEIEAGLDARFGGFIDTQGAPTDQFI